MHPNALCSILKTQNMFENIPIYLPECIAFIKTIGSFVHIYRSFAIFNIALRHTLQKTQMLLMLKKLTITKLLQLFATIHAITCCHTFSCYKALLIILVWSLQTNKRMFWKIFSFEMFDGNGCVYVSRLWFYLILFVKFFTIKTSWRYHFIERSLVESYIEAQLCT